MNPNARHIKINCSGQSTLEIMVLFAVIVAALVVMQVYAKRSMQGRMREYTEQLGDTGLYDPGGIFGLRTSNTVTLENAHTENSITNTQVTLEQVTQSIENTLPLSE